jgi:beta-N-acetylhexosaminidase
MTLREKCAQMVFLGCAFPDEDPDRTSQLVRKDGVGGLIVLGGSVFDVPSFVNWAQKVAKFPLLVAADFERGAAISGATAYPSGAQISATKSADFAQTKARHVGLEARALGIRLVFAPTASELHAKEAIDGYHYSKVAVCLQRFPSAGIAALAGESDAILVGHEVVDELDEEQIASLSRTAIQGILRRDLRFQGLVVTDAMWRIGTGTEILERAVNAGADVLLRPADPAKAIGALEAAVQAGRIAASTIDRAVMRLLLFKERQGLFAERMTDVSQVEKVVGAPSHREAADRMSNVVAQLRLR